MQRAITSPVTRELSDGAEYTFVPIGPAIWSEFCTYLNQCDGQPLRRLVPLDDMLNGAQSIDGMLWLAWASAKRNHPKLTVASLRELVTMGDLSELIPALTDLPEDDEEGSDPQEAGSP